MSKLYLDLPVFSSIDSAYRHSADEIIYKTGRNIGNLVFRHALLSLMADINEYEVIAYPEIEGCLSREPVSQVVMSCANWLSASTQYESSNGYRVTQISKFDCPVISFGLGAQALSGSKASELNLGPNTRRLAQLLAEKCNQLSVRDEFTYDVVKRLGINNAIVTGCPSNFINLDNGLGAKIAEKALHLVSSDSSWSQMKVHFSECNGEHAEAKNMLHRLFQLLSASPSFYVVQDPHLLPFILKEKDALPNQYQWLYEEVEDPKRIIRSKAMHFSSVDAWLDFSRTCDLALGMRIHGNMVPLQAGVPSLVVGHDSRTEGLADLMGVPFISPIEFVEASRRPPTQILELIAKKMSTYDNRRKELAKNWIDFMGANDIRINPALNALNLKSNE